MRPLFLCLLDVRRKQKKLGVFQVPENVQEVARKQFGWSFRTGPETVKGFSKRACGGSKS